jgi:hypothetical protein
MKLQLNGALTIGTLDGANVEIMEEVGEDNIFIFGLNAQEVEKRQSGYNPWDVYNNDEEIRRAIDLIDHDFFSMFEPGIFKPLIQSLLHEGDCYMVLADLRAYIQTQNRVDVVYKNRTGWIRKAILNVARAGKFSSDRTIAEYSSEIWHVDACEIVAQSVSTGSVEKDLRILDAVLKGRCSIAGNSMGPVPELVPLRNLNREPIDRQAGTARPGWQGSLQSNLRGKS